MNLLVESEELALLDQRFAPHLIHSSLNHLQPDYYPIPRLQETAMFQDLRERAIAIVPGNVPVVRLDRDDKSLFIDAALKQLDGPADSFYGAGGVYDREMLELLNERGVEKVWLRQEGKPELVPIDEARKFAFESGPNSELLHNPFFQAHREVKEAMKGIATYSVEDMRTYRNRIAQAIGDYQRAKGNSQARDIAVVSGLLAEVNAGNIAVDPTTSVRNSILLAVQAFRLTHPNSDDRRSQYDKYIVERTRARYTDLLRQVPDPIVPYRSTYDIMVDIEGH